MITRTPERRTLRRRAACRCVHGCWVPLDAWSATEIGLLHRYDPRGVGTAGAVPAGQFRLLGGWDFGVRDFALPGLFAFGTPARCLALAAEVALGFSLVGGRGVPEVELSTGFGRTAVGVGCPGGPVEVRVTREPGDADRPSPGSMAVTVSDGPAAAMAPASLVVTLVNPASSSSLSAWVVVRPMIPRGTVAITGPVLIWMVTVLLVPASRPPAGDCRVTV